MPRNRDENSKKNSKQNSKRNSRRFPMLLSNRLPGGERTADFDYVRYTYGIGVGPK